MSGIGAISSSTAVRVITPVAKPGDDGTFRHNESHAPRQAYATFGARPRKQPHANDFAPFIAHCFANDNGDTVSFSEGATAYDAMQHRLTDLTPGFLTSRAV